MTNAEFNEIAAEQIETCLNLLGVKGEEYDTDSNDRLHSFKIAAELQHITPKQALAGMLAKHTVSIYDMCAEGEHSLEKWTEKISDSINYLLLLKGMICEELAKKEADLFCETLK